MPTFVTYLIDDNEEQRRAFTLVLTELFRDTDVRVTGIPPLQAKEEYAKLFVAPDVSALILDQKMEDGGIAYSGTQLSEFLRAIVPKLPIYILSNYTNDEALFEQGEAGVEEIWSKDDVKDPTSRRALIFKARFLRRLGVYNDVLEDRARRYHNLLVKSLQSQLSVEEEKEIGLLDIERSVPQQAAEIKDVAQLTQAISELRRRIKPE